MTEKSRKIFKILLVIGVIALLILITSFIVSAKYIENSVEKYCDLAKNQYEGDCVEALIQVVDAESSASISLEQKNHTIWALGQMGDKRALPVLKKMYTGEMPDQEPYGETISQYELKKAIELIESGINLTHLMWKPKNFL